MNGQERIAAAFAGHGRRAALMPYLMGGYPDVETSAAALTAAVDAGADLIELGVPFSDPLADGPVIHAAATAALEAGVRPGAVLELCASIADRVPVVLMVYANVVMRDGAEAYAERAAAAGAAGLIVPDVPLEEADPVRAACDAAGIALVPLVAPTSTPARIRAVGEVARGFVYAVSTTGTTGEREAIADGVADLVSGIREGTSLPVAVGFGISNAEQAAAVAGAADGVIVGSRIVRAAGEDGAAGVGAVVAELAQALA